MLWRELLFLFVLSVACSAVQGPAFVSPFIINGAVARIQDHPYVVSVRRNGIHIGGGAIVSPTWALSAAHTLLGCPHTQVSLRAGSDERLIGGSLHNANSIVLHNLFDYNNLDNNIAAIGVLEPFVFSDTIAAVSLDIQGNPSNHLEAKLDLKPSLCRNNRDPGNPSEFSWLRCGNACHE